MSDKNWNDPNKIFPPQGLKILIMRNGDFTVFQRMGKYWLLIGFQDSEHCILSQPEAWSYIDFPSGYTGKVRIQIDGKVLDMDEYEKIFPEEFEKMVNACAAQFKVSSLEKTYIKNLKVKRVDV